MKLLDLFAGRLGWSKAFLACPPDVSHKEWRMRWQKQFEIESGGRKHCASRAAIIPPELANCVADYAERLIEEKTL